MAVLAEPAPCLLQGSTFFSSLKVFSLSLSNSFKLFKSIIIISVLYTFLFPLNISIVLSESRMMHDDDSDYDDDGDYYDTY